MQKETTTKFPNYYIVLFFFTLLYINCGNKNSNRGDLFYYNEDAGISSLDPAFAKDQNNIWAVTQLYNGLVELDSNLHIIPSLAKRWNISDSGKTYTFYLRDDIYFQDHDCFANGKGRKLNSKDIAYSLIRIFDPATASPGAWLLNEKWLPIANPKTDKDIYHNNKLIETPNDSTVVIHIAKAFPPFLGQLAMPYCFAIPHEAIEKYGKDFRSHPVGTGSFQLKFWEDGVKMVMERNPLYFEKDSYNKPLPYLNGIVVSFIGSKHSAFLEFLQGKLDFVNGLESSFKDDVLTKSGSLKQHYHGKFKLVLGNYLNTEYLGFLVDDSLPLSKNSPFANICFRQAISHAINRKEMVAQLRNNIGNGNVGGFIPKGLPGNIEDDIYEYNPEKARELLHKSGYNKKDEIVLYTTKNYLDLTVYIQNQLTAIGIKCKIENNPGTTHRQMVAKSQALFFRGSWIADYPDAENYLSLFFSKNFCPSGPNYFHYKNSAIDNLYASSLTITNDSIRTKLYSTIDKKIMDDAPVVVLFYDRSIRLLQNNISGLPTNPLNLLVLKRTKKLP
ncbi:MAG: ABC transporter substrate-binding protein [Bacteroidota bacterium]|nr:ABC transporter substrate-binding protein [Bacteroidota bacterium]